MAKVDGDDKSQGLDRFYILGLGNNFQFQSAMDLISRRRRRVTVEFLATVLIVVVTHSVQYLR